MEENVIFAHLLAADNLLILLLNGLSLEGILKLHLETYHFAHEIVETIYW